MAKATQAALQQPADGLALKLDQRVHRRATR
jgi:hypothetical protein